VLFVHCVDLVCCLRMNCLILNGKEDQAKQTKAALLGFRGRTFTPYLIITRGFRAGSQLPGFVCKVIRQQIHRGLNVKRLHLPENCARR